MLMPQGKQGCEGCSTIRKGLEALMLYLTFGRSRQSASGNILPNPRALVGSQQFQRQGRLLVSLRHESDL